MQSTDEVWKVVDIMLIRTYYMVKYPSYLWRNQSYMQTVPTFFYYTTLVVKYAYPLLLIGGTLSNIMSFAFSILTYKLSDLCIYFTFISVADTLTLWVNIYPSLHLLYFTHSVALVRSSAQCRLLQFLRQYSRAIAGWLLVATTVTRFMALRSPLTWRMKTTRFHLKFGFAVAILIALISSPSLFLYDHLNLGVGDFVGLCHMMPKGFITYDVYLYYTSFVFPILPVLTVAVLNISIFYKLWHIQHFRAENSSSSMSAASRQQVVTLLFVSSAFLTLSAHHVWNSLRQLYSVYNFKNIHQGLVHGTGPFFNMESFVASFVLYINNTINFYIYILSGKTLREEFFRKLGMNN